MGNNLRHIRGQAQKELVKKFDAFFNKGYSRWEVWSDWVTLSAIAISNATDASHAEQREAQYRTISKKYTKPDMELFSEILALFVVALEENPDQDFLGELYMCLEFGNDTAGQFFTPYDVCYCMAQITADIPRLTQEIKDKGWISVNDPACGAGALLVAFANVCRKNDINYQTQVLFVAQDIDYLVGMMCYLQMSLLGMPGYVVIGDTLVSPGTSYDRRGLIPADNGNIWYTPMLRRSVWQYRILAAHMDVLTRPMKAQLDAPESASQKAPEALEKPAKPKNTKKPKPAPMPPKEPEQEPALLERKGGQLSFF